jgi:hypothetical protein
MEKCFPKIENSPVNGSLLAWPPWDLGLWGSCWEATSDTVLALWADHVCALVEGGERKVIAMPLASAS